MSADEESESQVAIGISFGNSYSSIAFTSSEGKVVVIANEEGDRQIPSTLSYVDGTEFQGTQAKAQLVRNPKNTVAYFRDFLGKDFQSIDPTPCHQSAHPIKHQDTVAFSVHEKEDPEAEPSILTVSAITTRHISRLVQSASDFIGRPVSSAVITVPTNFTAAQKAALTAASKDAKVEVLQLIHEPLAALLAYDAREPEAHPADKIVVIADLGGTRSDVAVIASRGGMYTTLATAHDYDVGGAALDTVLVDYFAKEFLKKHKSAGDPRQTPRSLAKLTLEAEAVKKALSLGSSATLSVESLSDGIDFTCTVNRTRFDLLASKTFAAITRLVVSALTEKAGLDVLDVNELVLSGGTSHVPRIASNLAGAFPHSIVWAPSTRPNDAINPSELAARGAAVQASLVSEFEPEDIEESSHPVVTLTAHTTAALGIVTISAEGDKGVFVPIVDKDTPVPARRTKVFGVPASGGDVLIRLSEGTSEIVVKKVERKKEEKKDDDDDDDDDNDSDEDEDEDEDEEVREKKWVIGKTIAEAAIRGVKKGGKVEVQINIGTDLMVTMVARQVGAHGGIRGVVSNDSARENGSA